MSSVLKVNTIKNSTGTTAMSIDGTGNTTISQKLLTPARPAFRVAKTNSDQSVTSGQSSKVTFNNVVFEVGGTNIGTTDKFVAPVAGLYRFDACVRVGPDTNNASFYNAVVFLKKNNNLHVYLQQISTYANNLGGGTAHLSMCNLNGGVTTSLAANDEIEVWVTLEGSSPEVKSGADSDFTYFSGFLIG